MLDWSVSFSFSLSETVMVNRAPWYKQLKSIIPTNIPNQKARPRIKKMSINYKSQKKDFAFFHCSPPPKKKTSPRKKTLHFFIVSPQKKTSPRKKTCTIFCFFSKKKPSPRKKTCTIFRFFLKKGQVPKKLTQFRSSEQSILHSSSFSFFFFFFFFLQIEAPKSLVRTELNPPTTLPYISNLHTLQPSPLTPHRCNTCPNRNFPHSIINMMQQQKHK